MFSVSLQLWMFLHAKVSPFAFNKNRIFLKRAWNLPRMQKNVFVSDAGRACWGKPLIWVAVASLAALSHESLLWCRRQVICYQMKLIIVFALDRVRPTNLQVNKKQKKWKHFSLQQREHSKRCNFPKHVILIKVHCCFVGVHMWHTCLWFRISPFYFRIKIMIHKSLLWTAEYFEFRFLLCVVQLNSKATSSLNRLLAFHCLYGNSILLSKLLFCNWVTQNQFGSQNSIELIAIAICNCIQKWTFIHSSKLSRLFHEIA